MKIYVAIMALLLSFSGQQAAAGTWSVATISTHDSTFPIVAIDAKGNAVAVWNFYDGSITRISAAQMPAGGTWSSPVFVSPDGQASKFASLVVDPDGNAIAVWTADYLTSNSTTQAAILPLGATQWIASGSLSQLKGQTGVGITLTTDTNGNTLAFWDVKTDDNKVFLESARLPNRTQSWIQIDPYPCAYAEYNEDIAFYPDGTALAVWEEFDHGIKSATLAPDALKWTASLDLLNADYTDPRLAIDPSGNAVAICGSFYKKPTTAMVLPKGAKEWKQISFPKTYSFSDLFLFVDPAGTMLAVWRDIDQDNPPLLYSSLSRGSSEWSYPLPFSSPESYSAGESLAMDAQGNCIAIWYNLSDQILQGATLPFGKSWSQPFTIYSIGVPVNGRGDPQVALSSSGSAVVVLPPLDVSDTLLRGIRGNSLFSLRKKNARYKNHAFSWGAEKGTIGQ